MLGKPVKKMFNGYEKVLVKREECLGNEGVMAAKMRRLTGDEVTNYIRYDNYCNNAYMDLAYWENDMSKVVGSLLKGDLPRGGEREMRPFILVSWLGDLPWVLLMVGCVSFIGVVGRRWVERTGAKVLVEVFRKLFNKVVSFAYGREPLVLGGFKKVWEVWAMVYFSLVFREITPFSTQITFLGYPLAVLVFAGMLSLWASSFSINPVGFIGGIIPPGVPAIGAPFVILLMGVRGLLRPVVLTIRLRIAAILMVTLEGIFHYWCVKVADVHLAHRERI